MAIKKIIRAEGSHLDVRLAIIRSDYSLDSMSNQISFWHVKPPLFQSYDGTVDQFSQSSLAIFEFEEPFDGTVISLNGSPDTSSVSENLDLDGLKVKIQDLLKANFIENQKVASALSEVISGYWGCDGDFDELEDEVMTNLDEDDYEWVAEGGVDSITVDDESFAGGILLELVVSNDLPAKINPDGTLEVSDALDWDEYRRERCICLIKPSFKFGLKEAAV